ncbi:MAG TPA: hypothetical protein VFT22_09795 [Kofleriaceae bacterium]|nr:hypothetical protein [Kofleriaceae bacterium]
MARATWLLGATSLAGVALSLWLYFDNRALRAELADRAELHRAPAAASPAPAWARTAEATASSMRSALRAAPAAHTTTPAPALPEAPGESRMDRRARRTDELAQMFGRLPGESEEDYRSRVLPLVTAGLVVPRMRVEEQRKVAQDKAHVTPEQSARLDKAFDKIYGDVLDFTNKAVADGQLSPYERNVSGWLEYAGGLGAILNDANGQIGKILEPAQVKAMYDAGFEWGEYLGLKAPWEQLKPPPPPRGN